VKARASGATGAQLGELLQLTGLAVHLDTVLLRPGGGDPLALVELAVQRIRDLESKRGPYAIRAVLLDANGIGQMLRDARMTSIATAVRVS
jgi:hypothetical protein